MRSRKTYIAILLSLLLVFGAVWNNSIPIIIRADEDIELSEDLPGSGNESESSEPSTTPSSGESKETTSPSSEVSETSSEETSDSSENSETTSSASESASSESESTPSESETEPSEDESVSDNQKLWEAQLSYPQALEFSAIADPEAFEEGVSFKAELLKDVDQSTFEALIQAVLPDSEDIGESGDSTDAMPQMQMTPEPDSSGPEAQYEIYFYDLSFKNGEEQPVQPASDEPVTITIQGDELKGKELFQVYHQNSPESIEEVSSAEYDPENGTVTFSTSSFSPYAIVMQLPSNQDAIYLNGQSGDDNKDGFTPEDAVETFAEAKKLL